MSSTPVTWGNLEVPPGGAVSKKYNHVYQWLMTGESTSELAIYPDADASQLARGIIDVAGWGKPASQDIATYCGTFNFRSSLTFHNH